MYTPHVGRWLSEDPAGFVDGPHRYLYVRNNPTNRVDPSGMMEIDSGIKQCTGYIKGNWLWGWFPSHGFLLIDGVGYGFFEQNLNPVGSGEIKDTDAIVYAPTNNPASVPSGNGYAICKPYMIEQCCIDKDNFKAAVLAYIKQRTANPGSYMAGVRDCFTFEDDAVNYAESAASNGKCCRYSPPSPPGGPPSYQKPIWIKPNDCK